MSSSIYSQLPETSETQFVKAVSELQSQVGDETLHLMCHCLLSDAFISGISQRAKREYFIIFLSLPGQAQSQNDDICFIVIVLEKVLQTLLTELKVLRRQCCAT